MLSGARYPLAEPDTADDDACRFMSSQVGPSVVFGEKPSMAMSGLTTVGLGKSWRKALAAVSRQAAGITTKHFMLVS